MNETGTKAADHYIPTRDGRIGYWRDWQAEPPREIRDWQLVWSHEWLWVMRPGWNGARRYHVSEIGPMFNVAFAQWRPAMPRP